MENETIKLELQKHDTYNVKDVNTIYEDLCSLPHWANQKYAKEYFDSIEEIQPLKQWILNNYQGYQKG